MIRTAALAALLALAACGVDGPPRPPDDPPAERTTGLRISGTAEIGVAGAL